jgi:hypothetical protein
MKAREMIAARHMPFLSAIGNSGTPCATRIAGFF